MSERKNIDRLFQEKFKDFEAIPPKNAWNNILSELEGEKKKRKFIAPFWLRLSGIAAVFLLGFLTATYFITRPGSGSDAATPLVNSGNGENNTGNTSGSNLINKEGFSTDSSANAVVANENTKNSNAKNTALQPEAKANAKKQSHNVLKNHKKHGHHQIASTHGRKKSKTDNNNDALMAVRSNNDGSSKNTGRFKQFNFKKNNNNTIANYIVMPKKDSSDIAKTEEKENALEKIQKEKFLVAEKKKAKNKENTLSRWSVAALATPVFFSSTSNGSPIDNQFASNTKDYENTMSYGLGLRYELNNKFTLRTGINRLAFEYNTNNIVYYESTNARSLQNVNQTKNNIQIQNKNYTGSNGEIIDKMNSGTLTQRMGYIEVPMELSYKLIDKKFGVELIGGFSTLFLNQNKIDLVSSELNTTIGEANNLNDVHVSSNIGVGVKYRFAKAFEANFEPTFKYQLNMFSNDAGNFKPYLFGLYTGVSYRF